MRVSEKSFSGVGLQGEIGSARGVVRRDPAAGNLDSDAYPCPLGRLEHLGYGRPERPPQRKVQQGDRQHYVQAPPEVYKGGLCWRLKRWLYGMRPAARAWEEDYAE